MFVPVSYWHFEKNTTAPIRIDRTTVKIAKKTPSSAQGRHVAALKQKARQLKSIGFIPFCMIFFMQFPDRDQSYAHRWH